MKSIKIGKANRYYRNNGWDRFFYDNAIVEFSRFDELFAGLGLQFELIQSRISESIYLNGLNNPIRIRVSNHRNCNVPLNLYFEFKRTSKYKLGIFFNKTLIYNLLKNHS